MTSLPHLQLRKAVSTGRIPQLFSYQAWSARVDPAISNNAIATHAILVIVSSGVLKDRPNPRNDYPSELAILLVPQAPLTQRSALAHLGFLAAVGSAAEGERSRMRAAPRAACSCRASYAALGFRAAIS